VSLIASAPSRYAKEQRQMHEPGVRNLRVVVVWNLAKSEHWGNQISRKAAKAQPATLRVAMRAGAKVKTEF